MFRVLIFLGAIGMAMNVSAAKLLVLGDSLSAGYGIEVQQGWVKLLELRLAQTQYPYTVVNASISGETTQGGISRLPALLETHQPRVVLIELGANDGLRGTPHGPIKANLLELIRQVEEIGAEPVLFGIELPPNYGPYYAKRFSAMFETVAQEAGITYVPFFLRDVALKPELMQRDGLHPNAKAQGLILEAVWTSLDPLLSRLD
ncbi:MAG: arylesterase [Pontibacterium sp.]